MSWRPDFGSPSPRSAWYSESELAASRKAERERREFERMVEHRISFERAVAQLRTPTPVDLALAWRAAAEYALRRMLERARGTE
jgi:hypothetical protein